MATRYAPAIIIGVLAFLSIFIWTKVLWNEQTPVLSVTFLDVGQGDAIFIETPSKRQLLIDGGPDGSVLRELGKVMPFWDRSIDVVVATHPDADHIGGLVEVLSRYEVSALIRSGVEHDTPVTRALFTTRDERDVAEVIARRGQVFDFGDGVYVTILFPDRDVTHLESNTGSIILKVSYGEHSFLLTGDSPQAIERYIVSLDGGYIQSDVLKAGHHGSKTSSFEGFIGFANPKHVVVSRGCENRYGHPHQEVLEAFGKFELEILDTCAHGTVGFESDGSMLHVKSSQ